jgi:hypothetical protein
MELDDSGTTLAAWTLIYIIFRNVEIFKTIKNFKKQKFGERN